MDFAVRFFAHLRERIVDVVEGFIEHLGNGSFGRGVEGVEKKLPDVSDSYNG